MDADHPATGSKLHACSQDVEEELRQGPLADLRRIINSRIGLDVAFDDDAESDALTDMLAGNKGEGNKGKDNNREPHAEERTPKKLSTMHEANLRAQSLVKHVENTRAALRILHRDPLSIRNALGLRLLIMAILKDAAPVGEMPTADHALSAANPSRSWIRLLGGLLADIQQALNRRKRKREPMDEERLEAMSLLLFAAGMTLDAARDASLATQIVAKLQSINAGLAKLVMEQISNEPAASRYLENSIKRHELAHSAARTGASRPAFDAH